MAQQEPGRFDTILRRMLSVGIDGVPGVGFRGANELAAQFQENSHGERAINTVIRQHVAIVSASGFVCGVGGFATMPVTLPTDVTSFYTMATRMVATIAKLRGYDTDDEEVRTGILLSLLGSAAGNVAKEFGINLGVAVATAVLRKLPARVIMEINKRVGFQLFTKVGTRGFMTLSKFIPVLGGVVGGSMNGGTMALIAAAAKLVFTPMEQEAANPSSDTESTGV